MSTETSHAQHGEDLRILELLKPNWARFGVDVGANDGHSWSNSYLFGLKDFNLLLVEPMPVYAQRCRELYEGNDKITIVEAAISAAEERTTFFINDDPGDQLAMRSSLSRGDVPFETATAIEVRTVPLDRLLTDLDWPSHYAFLTVDAEGFDFEVLQTAGLDRFRPSVICVEGGERHDVIKRHLARLGYNFNSMLGPNAIYTVAE